MSDRVEPETLVLRRPENSVDTSLSRLLIAAAAVLPFFGILATILPLGGKLLLVMALLPGIVTLVNMKELTLGWRRLRASRGWLEVEGPGQERAQYRLSEVIGARVVSSHRLFEPVHVVCLTMQDDDVAVELHPFYIRAEAMAACDTLNRWFVGKLEAPPRVEVFFPEPVRMRLLPVAAAVPEVSCQICGQGSGGRWVRCRSCETPHHHDCWQYLEKCATYACGSRTCRAA